MADIRDSVRTAIERTLQSIATPSGLQPQAQSSAASAPPSPEAVEVLKRAQVSLTGLPDHHVAGDFIHTDDLHLSIVLSALEASLDPEQRVAATGAVLGINKYDATDPAWVLSLVNELIREKVPFIYPKKPTDFQVRVPDQDLVLAIAGDWGTGLPTSAQIAHYMALQNPDVTIHLGDVYYSGTDDEERDKFLKLFPRGRLGSFALNSNHEMYSGGHGYFNVLLKNPAFAVNQKASYFCISNTSWQIIGLDSAYEADKRNQLYQNGWLGAEQLQWLEYQLEQGYNAHQKTILMSHHNPVGIDGAIDQKFLDQILAAGKYHPFHYWYWGHEHDAAVYRVFDWPIGQVYSRCIGHGGIPYAPHKTGPTSNPSVVVEWTETEQYQEGQGDPRCGLNGFCVVTLPLAGDRLTETFYDDSGGIRVSGQYPPVATT